MKIFQRSEDHKKGEKRGQNVHNEAATEGGGIKEIQKGTNCF